MYGKKERIVLFDIVRFIGIWCIILYHMNDIVTIRYVSYYGWLFTIFFFFSSGFAMQYVGYDSKINTYTLSEFLKKRLGKIYLTYLGALIFSLLTQGLCNIPRLAKEVLMLTPSWFGVGDELIPINGATWFLGCLMVVYIEYYFICRYVRNESIRLYLFILFAIVGRVIYEVDSIFPFMRKRNGYAMLSFFAGCIFFALYKNITGESNKIKKIFIVTFSMILMVTILATWQIYGEKMVWGDYILTGTAWIMCPLLGVSSIAFGNYTFGISNKFTNWLTTRTMYYFVWHTPLYVFLRRLMASKYDSMYIVIILIILLIGWSELWHFLISKVAIRIIKK